MPHPSIFLRAARLWYDKDADHLAAALSYYVPFALTPLLFISVAAVGLIYGREFVVDMLFLWGSVLGADVLDLLEHSTNNLRFTASQFPVPLAGGIFFLGMVIVAFNTLTSGFHQLWGLPHRGLNGWLQKCARSAGFVFILQIYLIVIMGVDGLLIAVEPPFLALWSYATLLLSTTALFYLMYRLLPWCSPSHLGCLFGAGVASVLLLIAKGAVALYVVAAPVPKLYDAAGLIVVLLMWMFAATSIIYYGAALAHEYDKMEH